MITCVHYVLAYSLPLRVCVAESFKLSQSGARGKLVMALFAQHSLSNLLGLVHAPCRRVKLPLTNSVRQRFKASLSDAYARTSVFFSRRNVVNVGRVVLRLGQPSERKFTWCVNNGNRGTHEITWVAKRDGRFNFRVVISQ